MIKHVVCYKLLDKKNADAVRNTLLSLDGKVPSLRSIEVGKDFLCSERSFDLVLITVFDDRDGFEAYRTDAYHTGVVMPFVRSNVEKSVSVDFEF